MNRPGIGRSFAVVLLVCLGLLTFNYLAPSGNALWEKGWRKALKILHKRDLNAEDLEAQAEGYYEGLLDQSARGARASRLISGALTRDWTHWESQQIHVHQKKLGNFLYYEFLPNVAVTRGLDPVHTNSHGLADREYNQEKPVGFRRIAIIGDSITRGHGVAPGGAFEQLLEDRLNAELDEPTLEILNFGVDGYRITQLVEVALEKVPRYQPDVYLVALSDLSIFRKWSEHIIQILHDGIDLKYDFLRHLIVRAGIRRGDEPAAIEVKLAGYARETLNWALTTIAQEADRQGATLVVLFVPPVVDPDHLATRFATIRPDVEKLGIPVIDLLPAFRGLEDLNPYRISEQNHHPNAAGHQRLFEHVYRVISSNTHLRELILTR